MQCKSFATKVVYSPKVSFFLNRSIHQGTTKLRSIVYEMLLNYKILSLQAQVMGEI